MLGNFGTILQQISTAITGSGTIPTALAAIAIAIVAVMWMLGRMSVAHALGIASGIILLGSAATLAPQLL